jgi:L-lactate dehydrogenase complex protein LldG
LPDVDEQRVIRFDDPIAKFEEMLAMVGGEAHRVRTPQDIEPILAQIPVFSEARAVASLVPEAIEGNVNLESVGDPHGLSALDWTIAKGEFLVAENGAIWVDGKTLPHRVLLFIAQYLVIVVPSSQVVHHMHQAYDRLEGFEDRFGVFVSGPSKTADIEQSLVLGAHGCRKLQVFLVDEM